MLKKFVKSAIWGSGRYILFLEHYVMKWNNVRQNPENNFFSPNSIEKWASYLRSLFHLIWKNNMCHTEILTRRIELWRFLSLVSLMIIKHHKTTFQDTSKFICTMPN